MTPGGGEPAPWPMQDAGGRKTAAWWDGFWQRPPAARGRDLTRRRTAEVARALLKPLAAGGSPGPDSRLSARGRHGPSGPLRVLDLGCGNGDLTALLAADRRLRLVALDLSASALGQFRAGYPAGLPPRLALVRASVYELPFPDGAFDAVWCGNVLQYFSDADLPRVLAELRRVARPGGLVAVKDVDMQLVRLHPADPFLLSHLSEVSVRDTTLGPESRGALRARELRRWLERAGLRDVWQRTTLIERWAPLRPVERRLWTDWLAFLAGLAEQRGVPEEDLPVWRSLKDPESPDHLLNHPEFYACEGQVVAVGRVP